MQKDPSLKKGNLGTNREYDISGYAVSLFADSALLERVPEKNRGKLITDRVIGAIIANGEVQGSLKPYSPREIIEGIDALSGSSDYDNTIMLLPRAAGVRKTADLLATNELTGNFVGNLTERSGLGEYEPGGLASLDMLEGYLDAIEDMNRGIETASSDWTDWRKAVVDGVKVYAESADETPPRWDALGDLAASESDSLRQKGNEFNRASRMAEGFGVDFDLITATAERLRGYAQAKRDIGRAATRTPNYALFWQ